MTTWPRPESLVPERLMQALDAAQAGQTERALELCQTVAPGDALGGGVARLVRGLAAHETGRPAQAAAELVPLLRQHDPALALIATRALVERHVQCRRFSTAGALVRRMRRHTRQPAELLYLEVLLLWIQLLRRGRIKPEQLGKLENRLERRHPAGLHASMHLLRAESALLRCDFQSTIPAHREARPYVLAAGQADLRRRYEEVTRLLRAPFAEGEDWEEPLRPLTREDVADLETRNWQIWIDTLHRRVVSLQGQKEHVTILTSGRSPQTWEVLTLLMRSANRRMSWNQVRESLELPNPTTARQIAERLAKQLQRAGVEITCNDTGCSLPAKRFVFLFPTSELPRVQHQLLALLATTPGARAADLTDTGRSHSTTVRHLRALRQAGYARMVGGGRDARYDLV